MLRADQIYFAQNIWCICVFTCSELCQMTTITTKEVLQLELENIKRTHFFIKIISFLNNSHRYQGLFIACVKIVIWYFKGISHCSVYNIFSWKLQSMHLLFQFHTFMLNFLKNDKHMAIIPPLFTSCSLY